MMAWSRWGTTNELIRDTFRQACASGICWMMFGVTALCVALCLSIRVSGDVSLHDSSETVWFMPEASPTNTSALSAVSRKVGKPFETDPARARHEGVETVKGRLTLAFGAVSVPVSRERGDAVRFIELLLAGGIAGTFGLILTLVWTAGFVPSFLEPSAASVLLAKPVTRRQLLFGKYVGVLTFVGFQVSLFVALTWLALGIRTHIWDRTYLWCIPLLLLQFAVFYSFSVLLGVMTRSTVACVFGSVLFWLAAWGINYGSATAHDVAEPQYVSPSTLVMSEVAYWVFPKPIDAGLILFNALDAHQHFDKPTLFKTIEAWPAFTTRWSILSSFAIACVLLGFAAYEFDARDY